MGNENRNALYAKIAVAKKQLVYMDEEAYRDLLQMEFQKTSAKDLSYGQLVRLIGVLESKGAVFTKPTKQASMARRRDKDFYEIPDYVPHARQKRYIAALWSKMGYSMLSLDERCKRQFKIDAFLWVEDEGHMRALTQDVIIRAERKGIDTNPDMTED